MKLSLYTDYSLRVLLFLGAHRPRRVTLQEIADYYAISHEHLRKVVHMLGTLGYIDTFRGKRGGIELNLDPSQLRIGDVIAATEPRKAVIDCASQPCTLLSTCSLQGALQQAEAAFYNTLNSYTLAGLLTHTAMRENLIAASRDE